MSKSNIEKSTEHQWVARNNDRQLKVRVMKEAGKGGAGGGGEGGLGEHCVQ